MHIPHFNPTGMQSIITTAMPKYLSPKQKTMQEIEESNATSPSSSI
jgi:hypothetical protein